MQAVQSCIRRLSSIRPSSVFALCGECKTRILPCTIPFTQTLSLHTSGSSQAKHSLYPVPKTWPEYNEKIYPPQSPEEERRPAFVCHMKTNIKYSPKKMWYIACLVRGMSVDEAVRQLSFVPKKGAVVAKETILEAQQLAVKEHNVEFKSNLWVAESFVGKGYKVEGIRRHARKRFGKVEYKYIHYFVRLEEGPPPKQYYWKPDYSGPSMLERWVNMMRSRNIAGSL